MTATIPEPKPLTPFKLTADDLSPFGLTPIGDRYLIEELDVDDTIELGGAKIFRPQVSEKDRGWKVGVVCAVGNGHLLGVPDLAVAVAHKTSEDEMKAIGSDFTKAPPGAQYLTEDALVLRPPAAVPMFYGVGDVLLVERWAGRDLQLGDGRRKFCVVAQEHCLLKVANLKLARDPNGDWR